MESTDHVDAGSRIRGFLRVVLCLLAGFLAVSAIPGGLARIVGF